MTEVDHLAGRAADLGIVGSPPCQMVWQRPERERIRRGVKPCTSISGERSG